FSLCIAWVLSHQLRKFFLCLLGLFLLQIECAQFRARARVLWFEIEHSFQFALALGKFTFSEISMRERVVGRCIVWLLLQLFLKGADHALGTGLRVHRRSSKVYSRRAPAPHPHPPEPQ